MSTNRTSRDAGWVDHNKLPKGPNGRSLCRRCGTEVPVGRLTFCSRECLHEHKIRTNPSYVRVQVWKRDKGLCAQCGKTCERHGRAWQADHITPVVEGGGECGLDGYRTLCTACHNAETAALARRRAEARRQSSDETQPQLFQSPAAEQLTLQ